MTLLSSTPTSLRPSIARCASDRKMYLPYSSLRVIGGRIQAPLSWLSEVIVHWFIVGRSEPIVPYPTIIQGYQSLSASARVRAELMVDEFFREDEFHQFRKYLHTNHHEDMRTSMLTTPVSAIKPDIATRLGTLRPFRQLAPEQQKTVDIYRISEESGYSLPFTVWGAYIETNPSQPKRSEMMTERIPRPEKVQAIEVEGAEIDEKI